MKKAPQCLQYTWGDDPAVTGGSDDDNGIMDGRLAQVGRSFLFENEATRKIMYKDLIGIKQERAGNLAQDIKWLCVAQLVSPEETNLVRIGSYLGDFTNNLRSALNYAMTSFARNKLEPAITPHLSGTQLKRVMQNHDFPYADSKGQLDNKAIIPEIQTHFPAVYTFLEGVQPYHPGNEWLKQLMRISNTDKHEVINTIADFSAASVVGINKNGETQELPMFVGDKLFMAASQRPHFHNLPFYYRPLGAYAVKGGKWVIFLVPVDQVKLGLIPFIEQVPSKVEEILTKFNAFL